jgi:hypothetical protein
VPTDFAGKLQQCKICRVFEVSREFFRIIVPEWIGDLSQACVDGSGNNRIIWRSISFATKDRGWKSSQREWAMVGRERSFWSTFW